MIGKVIVDSVTILKGVYFFVWIRGHGMTLGRAMSPSRSKQLRLKGFEEMTFSGLADIAWLISLGCVTGCNDNKKRMTKLLDLEGKLCQEMKTHLSDC
ncbi:MAG: hypothetical protein AB7U29_03125 [Desulfobulbus sp.]